MVISAVMGRSIAPFGHVVLLVLAVWTSMGCTFVQSAQNQPNPTSTLGPVRVDRPNTFSPNTFRVPGELLRQPTPSPATDPSSNYIPGLPNPNRRTLPRMDDLLPKLGKGFDGGGMRQTCARELVYRKTDLTGGQDVAKVTNITTPAQCCAACKDNAACAKWTLKGSTCTLKGVQPTTLTELEDSTSGFRNGVNASGDCTRCASIDGLCGTPDACTALGGDFVTVRGRCPGALVCCAPKINYAGTFQEFIDAKSCSTVGMNAASEQLMQTVKCIEGTTKFASLVGLPGIQLSSSARVVPYLQGPAKTSLAEIVAAAIVNQTIAGRKSLTISSAIRTAPQQLALYSWQSPVCSSVPIASKPGSSNHHGGIAIDIGGVEREWWKQKLEADGSWKWLGEKDPPHLTYVKAKLSDYRAVHIKAFQLLWNKNNPLDRVVVNGGWVKFGETDMRMRRSKLNGFPVSLEPLECTNVNEAAFNDAFNKMPAILRPSEYNPFGGMG